MQTDLQVTTFARFSKIAMVISGWEQLPGCSDCIMGFSPAILRWTSRQEDEARRNPSSSRRMVLFGPGRWKEVSCNGSQVIGAGSAKPRACLRGRCAASSNMERRRRLRLQTTEFLSGKETTSRRYHRFRMDM